MSFVSLKYAKLLKDHPCWKDPTEVKFAQVWYYLHTTESGEIGIPVIITGIERKEEVEEILRDAIYAPTAEDILEYMPTAVIRRVYSAGYRVEWNPTEMKIPYMVTSYDNDVKNANLADTVASLYLIVKK